MNTILTRTAMATAVCAALLAPAAFGTAAVAATPAPAAASERSSDVKFSAKTVQSFFAGQPAVVTGTAAPGATVYVTNLPGSPMYKTDVADATGAWAVVSDAPGTKRFTVAVGSDSGAEQVAMLPNHEAGDDVAIEVDPIRFTPGGKLFVTGRAAPNAELAISGVPKDTSQGVGIAFRGLRVGADGTFRAGGQTMTTDLSKFDVTFALGGQRKTVTAESTEAAKPELRVTSSTSFVKGERITVTGKNVAGKTIKLYKVAANGKETLARNIATDAAGDWAFTTNGGYTVDSFTWKFVSEDRSTTVVFTAK